MKSLLAGLAVLALAAVALFTAPSLFGRGQDTGVCAATVRPGGDISRAVFDAPQGGTVCLEAGTHRPFSTAQARPGITVRGAGPDRTTVEVDDANAIDIIDIADFTLADLRVRGGDPSGIYANRVRQVTLRNVRLLGGAQAVHVENGVELALADVVIEDAQEFGLLVRRGASLVADRLRIDQTRGIAIGAVDEPGSVTLRDVEVTRSGNARGEGMVLNGWQRFVLSDVTVHGGNPAGIYVARARELSLRAVRVDSANFGLHLDENAVASAEDVELTRSTTVGLLLQRGGTITAGNLRVLDAAGTGVSAINGAGLVTLRDSQISRTAEAGLFAGVAGCDDLPPASLDIPACFSRDPEGQISTIRVALDRVTLTDTQGPCLVFFPGVHAEVRSSTFTRCELTGLFAWGATVDVYGSTFEDNAEHALEYRAYPDPRTRVIAPASGAIEDSVIRATRPLQGEILGALGPGPVLGGGILAQGSNLILRRNEVTANADIGVSFVNRSTGEVADNRITANGNHGLCLLPDSAVVLHTNTITGNGSDDPTVCGGGPVPAN